MELSRAVSKGADMFFIRADGNAVIGAGHLMRCLTVADEVKKRQAVSVLCSDSNSASLARERGYFTYILGEEPFSEQEAVKVLGILKSETKREGREDCPVVLVDSYIAGEAYIRMLAGAAKVACLDDMAQTVRPAAWKVINYNVYANKEEYRRLYDNAGAELPCLILGPAYAPIRPQFLERKHRFRPIAKSILITTGGGDHENIAGKILEHLLKNEKLKKMQYHVVSGAFSPNYEALQKLKECYENITVHRNVENMAELMADCDIAITAGGSTVYELCAVGTPFICFAYAENQRRMVTYMEAEEADMGAGYYPEDRVGVLDKIDEVVGKLSQSEEKRRLFSDIVIKITDDRGAARLAEELLL